MVTFGNKINNLISASRNMLFFEGEMAQLSFISFSNLVESINQGENEEYTFSYPIGYNANNQVINGNVKYTKEDLVLRTNLLAHSKLPINSIYQLVTITETLLVDIIRWVLQEYPMKISNKRKLNAEIILEAESLEQVKFQIIDSIVNELAYKSPTEFAESFNTIIGINFLEEPSYHQYVELKATRDIHIHNKGFANRIYLEKAKTLARVKSGQPLPVDMVYFLKSYETCIQITEFLEKKLDSIWPSQIYRDNQTSIEDQKEKALKEIPNNEAKQKEE